jgi:hypothetical protein
MGQNSTDTAYNFGQFGSTFLTGDGAKLTLTASTAKYYICAVTIIDDATKFEALEVLDGGVGLGMGDTYFAHGATDGPYPLDTTWHGAATTDTTAETDEDSDPIPNTQEFPAGITLYGMWDNVELAAGTVICYVAPRHDYRTRA